ncbi:RT0821/Lpp0805 family surface protein [Pseudohoeflea coraliihabitans]|uniref:Surface antigen domain-containing protein n=1 Tax=Pseudohoeflea coraliihabitans TaxID=2860393 RepID=A0ABS6WPE7_9HYPH|nr:RT0821/Lpp0805 family surface protein [Pseudohoeflea sp. DP4N28-3]MBW3096944.1 hypothetical protein [Pseudohoeflea sp. DP4N28-3]
MDDLAKALVAGKRRASGSPLRRVLVATLAVPLLATGGCMSSSSDPVAALKIDPSITGSITPLSVDADVMSDERVIARAVGAADPKVPSPWANNQTGAAGVISAVFEIRKGKGNCRSFRTSRHGFDGIALYEGVACQAPDGAWTLSAFERSEG